MKEFGEGIVEQIVLVDGLVDSLLVVSGEAELGILKYCLISFSYMSDHARSASWSILSKVYASVVPIFPIFSMSCFWKEEYPFIPV